MISVTARSMISVTALVTDIELDIDLLLISVTRAVSDTSQ